MASTSKDLRTLQAEIARLEREIAFIHKDAERRIGPLRELKQSFELAVQELGEHDGNQHAPLPDVASQEKLPRIRSLILNELGKANLPLSKIELIQRFAASGLTIKETTVGSTLSNMLRENTLVKTPDRRYWAPTLGPLHGPAT